MICARDCFNCPFPDCVCDEETQADIDAAERRDEQIMAGWSKHEKILRQQREYRRKNRDHAIAASRAYYATHKEYVKEKHAEWYRANREQILAQQKAYRDANKEKISARKRDQYRKKKEAAQLAPGTASDRNNDHASIVAPDPVQVKAAIRDANLSRTIRDLEAMGVKIPGGG